MKGSLVPVCEAEAPRLWIHQHRCIEESGSTRIAFPVIINTGSVLRVGVGILIVLKAHFFLYGI